MKRGCHAWAFVLVALVPSTTLAQSELPEITDRDYAIDLYQGAVLGSARIVGMGGAAVAVAEGSAGILANPAAVAVWPATSNGKWDWDFHIDYLNRLPGQDLDNNGIEDPNADLDNRPFVTGGLIGRYGIWALGVTGSANTEASPAEGTVDSEILAQSLVLRVAAGAALFEEALAVGVAIKIGQFSLLLDDGSPTNRELLRLSGGGIEVGATWAPHKQDFRLGASLSTPISESDEVELNLDDPGDPSPQCLSAEDCYGYILPSRVVAPWRLAVGAAWRRGATRWNQKIGARWRDERSLVVAGDLIVIGSNDGGYGIGAFAQKRLQRSGKSVSVTGRVGAEYEWLPSRLRLRAGAYWEPSRFEGVSGRIHATVGLDVRVWRFCFRENAYRVMLGLFGDGADGYGNAGVTAGFWH